MERRIANAKDMHASGLQCMNELAKTLKLRSITDSEQMELNISSHAIAVGNVRIKLSLLIYLIKINEPHYKI
jgi:hypothetical protein